MNDDEFGTLNNYDRHFPLSFFEQNGRCSPTRYGINVFTEYKKFIVDVCKYLFNNKLFISGNFCEYFYIETLIWDKKNNTIHLLLHRGIH